MKGNREHNTRNSPGLLLPVTLFPTQLGRGKLSLSVLNSFESISPLVCRCLAEKATLLLYIVLCRPLQKCWTEECWPRRGIFLSLFRKEWLEVHISKSLLLQPLDKMMAVAPSGWGAYLHHLLWSSIALVSMGCWLLTLLLCHFCFVSPSHHFMENIRTVNA